MDMARITQADFARLCGVNRSTVSRWLKAGRIQSDADGRINPEAAQRLRAATESPLPHHQARKAQFDEARAGRDSGAAQASANEPPAEVAERSDDEPPPAGDSLAGINLRIKHATARKQDADAAKALLEVGRMAGTLVELEDVRFALDDITRAVRGEVEALPDRLAGEIAAKQGNVNAIHKVLEDAARDMLHAMSAHMQRRLEGFSP